MGEGGWTSIRGKRNAPIGARTVPARIICACRREGFETEAEANVNYQKILLIPHPQIGEAYGCLALFSERPTGSPLPCLPFLDHHHFGRLDQRHGLITHLETQCIQGITRDHCRNLVLANVEIDLRHDHISFNG